MTKRITKLQLNRETVRQLDGAAGAAFMATSLCFPPIRPQTSIRVSEGA
jgi:hypothetical protein